MPRICTRVAMPGGGVAIITTSSSINPNDPCDFCVKTSAQQPRKHDVLCDFPIRKGKGLKRYTCSRRLCSSCAHSLGSDIDMCPVHAVLVIDHELAPRLVPLLKQNDRVAHDVALDLVEQAQMAGADGRRFVPKGLADWHEFFTERAAIFEYEGGLLQAEAEMRARAVAGARPRPTPR